MRLNEPVTQQEFEYPDHWHLITTTDLSSRITSLNEEFLSVAGYEEQELLGQPHNVIRHPDMPPEAFEDLWQIIQAGQSWKGLVKNRCKNGDHYWVDAFVTPILRDGEIVEYQSVRVKPTQAQIHRAEAVYAALRSNGRLPRRMLASAMPLQRRIQLGWFLAVLAAGSGWLTGLVGTETSLLLLAAVTVCATGLLTGLRPFFGMVGKARSSIHPMMPYLYTGRRDDMGWLIFERLKQKSALRAVSARMHTNVERVKANKDNTTNWVGKSMESIRSQQEGITSINQAFDELEQSVNRVSELTEGTTANTGEINETMDQTYTLITRLDGDIRALSEQLKRAEEGVTELATRSVDIDRILEVITEIAEQTNLLSLNAAIEAARAGEAGRGFAVVAEEVRGLAQRTHTSTREIADIITKVRAMTADVESVIKSGNESSANVLASADTARKSLEQTRTGMQSILDQQEEVSAATSEQAAVSQQVRQQVRSLGDLGHSSVKSSEDACTETKRLSSHIDEMQVLARHFLDMMLHSQQKEARREQPSAATGSNR